MQRLPETTCSGGPEDAVLAIIRKAAEETLAVWPEAMAAVLFGSRARGDHSPSSDWDIAFITGKGRGIGPIPSGLPILGAPCEVDCLKVPKDVARRNALAIGHVGRAVVRDGKLLAGSWNRPSSKGTAMMRPDEFARLVRNAITSAGNAAARMVEIGETANWWDKSDLCGQFAAESANAAEHLAKAKLGRHGIDFARTHDLNRLADQAERAGLDSLARDVRSMNGLTRNQHMATYGGVTVEDCRHAVSRFMAFAKLLGDEIQSAKAVPGLAETVPETTFRAISMAAKHGPALRRAAPLETEPGRLPLDNDPVVALVRSRAAVADALNRLSTSLEPAGVGVRTPEERPSVRPKPEIGYGDDGTSGFDIDPFRTPTPFD